MTKRITSALVMLALVIPTLLAGGIIFKLGVVIVAGIALYEMFNIRGSEKELPYFVKMISYVLLFFFIISDTGKLSLSFEYKYLAAFLIALFLPLITYHNRQEYTIQDATFAIANVLFLGIVFNLLIAYRDIRLGYVVYLLLITISSDTFAQLGGRLIGKHKMSPQISPAKTIEGGVYGFLMATALSSSFYYVVIDNGINILVLIAMSATLSISAALGDLIFSSIKRYYNKKDYSQLIPGHGGVLDRLDSLIFVILTFVLFITLL